VRTFRTADRTERRSRRDRTPVLALILFFIHSEYPPLEVVQYTRAMPGGELLSSTPVEEHSCGLKERRKNATLQPQKRHFYDVGWEATGWVMYISPTRPFRIGINAAGRYAPCTGCHHPSLTPGSKIGGPEGARQDA
jgi:hypothetical protein